MMRFGAFHRGMIRRQWLRIHHVQPGAGDLPLPGPSADRRSLRFRHATLMKYADGFSVAKNFALKSPCGFRG